MIDSAQTVDNAQLLNVTILVLTFDEWNNPYV
jgi:hypothetical protein